MRLNRVRHYAFAAASATDQAPEIVEKASENVVATLRDIFSPSRIRQSPSSSPDALQGAPASSSSPGKARWKKEIRNERKSNWVDKNVQGCQFERPVRMCSQKWGCQSAFDVLSKLGRDSGIKECNSLIRLYIGKARKSISQAESLVEVQKVFCIFKFINEKGFHFEEETYRPLFMYLIDMKMVRGFQSFIDLVRESNSPSVTGLGYYEMLLYIKVSNKQKIQDIMSHMCISDDQDGYGLAENYLLAFCDTDSKLEIMQFLEMFGTRKLSSQENTVRVFNSFGRLYLESIMENFVLDLQKSEMEDISSSLSGYVTCLPNLSVEVIVSKFNFLHQQLKVIPSLFAYEKLIAFCCKASKVDAAVDIAKQMYHSGLVPSNRIFDLILWTIEHNGESDLVQTIYPIMQQINLVPGEYAIKCLIKLFMRIRDFAGAHHVLEDLKEMKRTPTVGVYNALMAGYFRENNVYGVLLVGKLMKDAAVERDAETFSYLITNCTSEKRIEKYYKEMKESGIGATREVFMALINAFANVGRFDKAKKVILDNAVPEKHLNEIKSVLISALAANGEVASALDIYNEMKRAGGNPQAKAVCTLIEYMRSEGKIDILLQLLGELSGSKIWFDASGRVFLYCVCHNILDSAVELLKEMRDMDEIGACAVIDQAFSQYWEKEPTELMFGLQLLQAVEELGFRLSRASLDFLLSCCIKARDPVSAQVIWSHYSKLELPHNVLTFLRMYQVLLSCGEISKAQSLLKKMENDDPHVRLVLKACDSTYNFVQTKNKG